MIVDADGNVVVRQIGFLPAMRRERQTGAPLVECIATGIVKPADDPDPVPAGVEWQEIDPRERAAAIWEWLSRQAAQDGMSDADLIAGIEALLNGEQPA